MAGFLFQDIVFGPIHSRRFGTSLGINLLPLNAKVCSFNCIYCECGLTRKGNSSTGEGFYDLHTIISRMAERFKSFAKEGVKPDNITFAGNGEPTLHPDFPQIIDEVIRLRDLYFPSSRITVLSNASLISDTSIRVALMKVDNNVLKLDAGTEAYLHLINRPLVRITLAEIIENLKLFGGNLVIQSLFLKGTLHGKYFNNASDEHVALWLKHLYEIAPRKVMIYPIDRATPEHGIEKISKETLDHIAGKVEKLGIKAEVYY